LRQVSWRASSGRADGPLDVLKTHPKVLLGGHVVENPYYLSPERNLADSLADSQGA
jgi:hypothetical protein